MKKRDFPRYSQEQLDDIWDWAGLTLMEKLETENEHDYFVMAKTIAELFEHIYFRNGLK